jgi:adenylate kinase
MRFYMVLLGPPGAGKGTQAEKISEKLQLPHISSGDIFRENLKKQTELGKLADRYISRGELVPDNVTTAMVRERLSQPDCSAGAVLDGFPRTVPQAEALADMLLEFNGKVNVVPYINVSEEVLIERLSQRLTCKAQGHIFHPIYNPPKKPGICDIDGSELYQRDDDKIETVKNRLKVYQGTTLKLINYYRKEGVLKEVDGMQSMDQVTESLMKVIKRQ